MHVSLQEEQAKLSGDRSAKLTGASPQKTAQPCVNETLRDVRSLINHSPDRYCGHPREKPAPGSLPREHRHHGPALGSSDSAELQPTHLSCRQEPPRMCFQLTTRTSSPHTTARSGTFRSLRGSQSRERVPR